MNAELIREEIIRLLMNVTDEEMLIRILVMLAAHSTTKSQKLN